MADRVALVTGASRGIGRATALALARAGARVLAVARSAEALEQLAHEADIEPIVCSIDTPEGCARVAAEAHGRAGPVTILVNNAGRAGYLDRPIWEQDREGWRATMDVNLDAPFELTRLLVGDMLAARWGRIVMISSTARAGGGSRHVSLLCVKARGDRADAFGGAGRGRPRHHLQRRSSGLGAHRNGSARRSAGGRAPGPQRRGSVGRARCRRTRRGGWQSPRRSPTWSPTWPPTRRRQSTGRRSPFRSGAPGEPAGGVPGQPSERTTIPTSTPATPTSWYHATRSR